MFLVKMFFFIFGKIICILLCMMVINVFSFIVVESEKKWFVVICGVIFIIVYMRYWKISFCD